MHRIIFPIIILSILLLIVCKRERKPHRSCGCSADMKKNNSHITGMYYASKKNGGLNDLSQDVNSRGNVPAPNQPDHIANLWKCEHSHARQLEGSGCLDTIFSSDYETPVLDSVMSQSVQDVSNMHKVSRFAVVQS